MDFQTCHVSVDALEEVAEAYVMNKLNSHDLAEFEEHLLVCRKCQNAVAEADHFIHLLRAAAGSTVASPLRFHVN